MVSSTFKDLEEHRAKLIKTLHRQKLFAIEIEDRSSKPDDDVIPSSLNMVRDASGYIGLTSHRYGQVPEDDERNPDAYSMTRLGFEEAKRLGLPTLIFVMGADHPTSDREPGSHMLSLFVQRNLQYMALFQRLAV